MVLGTVLGAWMFEGIGIWAIVLMAFILSPTDAALGQAVVKSEAVPINIRQSISVESGLNDGIALPPILIVMALLGAEAGDHEGMQLMLVVFLIFGLVMVPAAVPYWGARELIYALLSLTVIRMLPLALKAMSGSCPLSC